MCDLSYCYEHSLSFCSLLLSFYKEFDCSESTDASTLENAVCMIPQVGLGFELRV